MNRRLLNWFVDGWRSNDRNVRKWLQTRELWFVLSANPDGYQYTFDVERLWRKNLRDNDGDGMITGADGVDLNRNYETKWNWDNEGSSSSCDETYRGTRLPPSRREARGVDIIKRIGPSSYSRTTRTGPSSSIRTAGRSRLRPRTIRSTSPTRARTRSRPSPDSTLASRPTST
jgi:hypothetical protein